MPGDQSSGAGGQHQMSDPLPSGAGTIPRRRSASGSVPLRARAASRSCSGLPGAGSRAPSGGVRERSDAFLKGNSTALILKGLPGIGKTYILEALAKERAAREEG